MSKFSFKTLMFRSGVTALSLLFTLVIFEYYLRTAVTHVVQEGVTSSGGIVEANPEFLVQQTARGRRFVPNARVVIKNHFLSKRDISMGINSLGFRGPELPAEKAQNEWRIAFLGDSITVADYLPESELFTSMVENSLASKYSENRIVAINTAIGNIGIEEEVNILEDTLDKVRPDVIVLGFYLNDSRPPWGFSGEIGDRGWLRRHSLIAELTYALLEERKWIERQGADRFAWIPVAENGEWRKSREAFDQLTKLALSDWGAAWNEKSWETIEQNLQRLKVLAERSGTEVLVVTFPVLYQVEAEFVEDSPQRKMAELAARHEFSHLDLLPILREHRSEALFLDHCHPSARGNEIIAEAITSSLEQAGMVPVPKAGDHSEVS